MKSIVATSLILMASTVSSTTVTLESGLDSDAVMVGSSQRAYLRVALTGREIPVEQRPPVNLGLVIDRSGSMQGDKIEQARQAALDVINRLRPDDVVSIVAYDSTVEVLAPARRVADQPDQETAIRSIEADGSTALFAGLAKGGYEVRRFISPGRVNRLLLLSDGIANVGPSSPGELAELGRSLGSEGIGVTTIGLGTGYNEVLMDRLAQASDGNHFFAERAEDLARVFDRELGEVLSVVATNVSVRIDLEPGVRVRRALGRPVQLIGGTAEAALLQLYSRQTKYFLIELELPPRHSVATKTVATVSVEYTDLAGAQIWLGEQVGVRYTDQLSEVEAGKNPRVLGSVARQLGAIRNQLAMQMRDEGKIEEARKLLLENAAFLEHNAELLNNRWLARDAAQNRDDAKSLADKEWLARRKEMTQQQFEALRGLGYIQ
jgi:Ca-activated chloride channel family protein